MEGSGWMGVEGGWSGMGWGVCACLGVYFARYTNILYNLSYPSTTQCL